MDVPRKEDPDVPSTDGHAGAGVSNEPSKALPSGNHNARSEDPEELRRALLEQLPPMDPSQVVPFGHLLDRTVKIRYEALRHLIQNR